MKLHTGTTSWSIKGSASFPPVGASLSFGQNGSFASANNNAFALSSGQSISTAWPFDFDYGQVVNECNSCGVCAPGVFCACPPLSKCTGEVGQTCRCPTGAEKAQESCTNCSHDFANLGDGQLPYYAPNGGAAGGHFYPDTTYNWMHFGKPGNKAINGEAFAQKPSDGPTTQLEAGFGFDLGPVSLNITADVYFRDSFAIVTGEEWDNEFRDHNANVRTLLDAQSSAKVSAHLIFDLPLPFISHPIIDAHFDILPEQATGENQSQLSKVLYNYANGNPISAFTSSRGNESIPECTSVPSSSPPIQPSNPGTFLQNASNNALDQIHPCHGVVCDPDGASGQKCEWIGRAKKFVCTHQTFQCQPCTSSIQMCDAQGRVIPSIPTYSHHGTCIAQ
jgi:hypothetical protein